MSEDIGYDSAGAPTSSPGAILGGGAIRVFDRSAPTPLADQASWHMHGGPVQATANRQYLPYALRGSECR